MYIPTIAKTNPKQLLFTLSVHIFENCILSPFVCWRCDRWQKRLCHETLMWATWTSDLMIWYMLWCSHNRLPHYFSWINALKVVTNTLLVHHGHIRKVRISGEKLGSELKILPIAWEYFGDKTGLCSAKRNRFEWPGRHRVGYCTQIKLSSKIISITHTRLEAVIGSNRYDTCST